MTVTNVRDSIAAAGMEELSAGQIENVGGGQNMSFMQLMKLVIDIASGCDVKTTPGGTIYTTCPDTPTGPPQIV